MAALLANSRVKSLDLLGVTVEHGVLYEHAQSFVELCGRRPFFVDRLTFGFTTENTSSITHCKFWIKLLRPKSLTFYSTAGGVHLSPTDYYWILTQEVQQIEMSPENLSVSLIAQIINKWYRGKTKFLPSLDLIFSPTSETKLIIGELLDKTPYK
ncbi:hypothetical protein KIN20_016888, partial [Parelaphostrongylus tenuis]